MDVAADCGDAAELLAAVARERPEVCVLDRELRGGGLAATAAIASPPRAPKVLLIGGRGSPAEVRAALLAGAADCLASDVAPARLAAAVAALAGAGPRPRGVSDHRADAAVVGSSLVQKEQS